MGLRLGLGLGLPRGSGALVTRSLYRVTEELGVDCGVGLGLPRGSRALRSSRPRVRLSRRRATARTPWLGLGLGLRVGVGIGIGLALGLSLGLGLRIGCRPTRWPQ